MADDPALIWDDETPAPRRRPPRPSRAEPTPVEAAPPPGGRVTLKVYDVSGRHVQTLFDGKQDAGRKEATWNARDSRGRPVASGVYFYRLVAPGFEETRKMVLLQ